jgi:hypothetical protein
MQVKCLYRPLVTYPFLLIDNSLRDNGWSAILNSYADSSGSAIAIDVETRINGSYGGFQKYESCKGSALYMVGGRKSIVNWLRLQGQTPKISHPSGNYDLYAIVMRKRERFSKNLTTVVISALPWAEPGGGGWEKTATYDLKTCPEAKVSPHTGTRMCEFTPQELGNILDRYFGGQDD